MSSTIVGSLTVNHSVDPNGSLFLKVPIKVPPAKLAPDLSISYHSAVHQLSVLGHGWDLHAFGIIQRTAATIAQDGFSGSINYGSHDKFTLNGQRLMHISGNEYRYEIEQWSKIIAVGSNLANPESWIEYLPNGTMRKYGSTMDSNLKAVGRSQPATRVWALAEICDPFTNYASWSYAPADVNGALILNNIQYGGNRTLNMQHQRNITFSYADRQDVETEFVGGSPVRLIKRLVSISASFNSALLHTHTFGYDYAPVTGFTRLQTATISDASGASVEPLKFNWSDSAPSVFKDIVTLNPLSADVSTVRVFPADIDGSGRTDLLLASKKYDAGRGMDILALDVHLADGNGGIKATPESSESTGLQYPNYLLALDVNGNGRTDLLHVVKNAQNNHILTVLLSAGTAYRAQSQTTTFSPAVPNGAYYSGDFQGNGNVGLVYLYNRGVDNDVCLVQFTSDGTSFLQQPVVNGPRGVDLKTARLIIADFNGDGASDIFLVSRGRDGICSINFFQSQGGLLAFKGDTIPRTGAQIQWTSTVGFLALPERDGKTGLLLLRKNVDAKLEFQTIRSTGQSFSVSEIKNTGLLYRGDINLGRITSANSLNLVNTFDGTSGTQVSVLQFINDTFVNVPGATQPGRRLEGFEVNFGDFRGIGRADCLFSIYDVNSRQLKLSILPSEGSLNAPADFIVCYTGGLGATLSVSYAPLTDSTVYEVPTSDSGAANPYVNALSGTSSSSFSISRSNTSPLLSSMMGGSRTQLIRLPKYVVKSLTSCALPSAHPDIISKSEYRYKNARVSFDGRGWLGFESVIEHSHALHTSTTNTYIQKFPFIGQISKSNIRELSDSNAGKLLKSTVFSLEKQSTNSVHRITVPKVRQTSYESGQAAHLVVVANEYDSYSNITQTTITSAGKPSLIIARTYSNNVQRWIIGSKLSESITSDRRLMKQKNYTHHPGTQVVNQVQEWISDSSGSTITDIQFDGAGNVTASMGPWHAKRTFIYDSTYSFPATVTDIVDDQSSLTTSAIFDYAVGEPKSVTEPNGHIWTQRRDVLGRVIEIAEGEHPNSMTVIDKRSYALLNGQPACIRDILCDQTSNSWSRETDYLDGMERTWKKAIQNVSDPSLTVYTEIRFDGAGRITRRYRNYTSDTTTPVYSEYTYDSFSRQKKVVSPSVNSNTDHVMITYDYSYTNNQSTVKQTKYGDGPSTTIQTVLEYFPNPETPSDEFVVPLTVSSVDELGQTITTAFDALHRVVSIRDPSEVCLSLQWDSISRVTSRKLSTLSGTDPSTINHFSFQYNDLFRKTIVTNHLTNSTTIVLKDRLDRTTKRTTPEEEIIFTYDNPIAKAQGKVHSARSSKGVSEVFTYDARGNMQRTSLMVDDYVFNTSFEHTPSRQLKKITNPDGSVLRKAFFHNSDIVKDVQLLDGNTSVSSTFSDFSNAFFTPLVTDMGNGIKHTVSLANNGAPVKSVLSKDATAIHQQSWRLDSYGRLGAYNPTSAANTERIYQYNLGGQLVRSQSAGRTSEYSYDRSGNLLSKNGNSHHNQGWQISSITESSGNILSFEYTPDGHRTKEIDNSGQATRTMVYDSLGQTTKLNSTSFLYDFNGRMIKATSADGSVTYYPSESYELIVRGNNKTRTAYLLHQTRRASITTVTDDLGRNQISVLYYHHDHLGSVVAVFDGTGNNVTRYSYDEFGATILTSGSDKSRYKYSGKELFDGLYYFGARFYDPKTGRFTTLDTITSSLKGITPSTFNQYTFSRNDPVNFIDMNGNLSFWWHFAWHM